MKKTKLIGSALLVLMLLLAGCAPQEQQPVTEGKITGLDFSTVIYDLAEDYQARGTVKCLYAAVEYSGENAAAAKINTSLQEMMDSYVLETAGYDEMLTDENPELTFTHERSYALAELGEDYLSILAEGYDMTSGAAHPHTYLLGYVYDLHSGEQISLAELLPENYRELLQAEILNQIRSSQEQGYYYPNLEEAVEIALISENWYLAEDCIWLIFNPGQIAANAAGILLFPYHYRG
jgi:hypothetical protein